MKILKSYKMVAGFVGLIFLSQSGHIYAQALGASGELKWLRINSLHTYFSEQGSQSETGGTEETNISFSWPGEYGIDQYTMRSQGMWLGCRNYHEAVVDRTFDKIVVNVGLKPNEYTERPIFDAYDFRLIGKFDHPIVNVDGSLASELTYYDVLDDIDPDLPADRLLIVKNHTLIGVDVIKKVYAWSTRGHDNYYIYDYVLKNTGIIDNDGTTNDQTIQDFYFLLAYRYTFAGESIIYNNPDGTNWGTGAMQWGGNVVNDVVGRDPAANDFEFRAQLSWYGPNSAQPVTDDWGCPNYKDDGVMAAAKYAGRVVLHADKSTSDRSDNLYQPSCTRFTYSDDPVMQRASSPYNEIYINQRYDFMASGHDPQTHAELLEASGLTADVWSSGTGTSGHTITQGFGPYTLETGDSVHIVVAGAVSGISREKNREVGGNWIQYVNGTGTPELIKPDGSATTDHDEYKREWVWTCKDSLFKAFRNAIANYESGYSIPQAPPPPEEFTVKSGGDRISLSWSDNAVSAPNFDGYVIYRAQGNVMQPKTKYRFLFECDASDAVHEFDDVTAIRGFDYYYCVQSKAKNPDDPSQPLVSSMFWTLTSVPATLQRPQGMAIGEVRVVPNPYDIRSRRLQFGDESQYDRIAFYELPGQCKLKVFTERGDLIWEKEHVDGSGDELWDSMTSSRQIVVSGIYILYVEVTEDIIAEEDVVA
ncbi:hypothetical protein JW948_15560, partial [bacterium]|nr:hypothetical protein [bacterium]